VSGVQDDGKVSDLRKARARARTNEQSSLERPSQILSPKPERASLAIRSEWMARHRYTRTRGLGQQVHSKKRCFPTQILAFSGPFARTCDLCAARSHKWAEGRGGQARICGDIGPDMRAFITSPAVPAFPKPSLALTNGRSTPVAQVWRAVFLHAKPYPLISQPLRSPAVERQAHTPGTHVDNRRCSALPELRCRLRIINPVSVGKTPLRERSWADASPVGSQRLTDHRCPSRVCLCEQSDT
jgi:hypothetical protein